MTRMPSLLVVLTLLAAPVPLVAQRVDVRARLEARGLPAGLAREVAAIAARASTRGVPAGPLADKAIEGWAKRVPEPRIVGAVQSFADRMVVAAQAVRSGGLEAPPGRVVAAAAEAMGGGLGAEEVRQIVRAAPTPAAAAPGLSVVAALTAQGLGSGQAVTIVVDALHSHRAVSDLLNLPSAARALQDEGMSPGEVGRRILDGGDGQGGVHSGGDGGGEPESGIPPGTGRGHEPHPPNPSHP